MKIKIIHRPLTPTFVSIEKKNDFSLSLEEEEQNVPECLLLLHARYTDSHTNVQTHDRAYSVFFRIVSVSSTDVSFTVIL